MQRVAQFEKVSFEEFNKSWKKLYLISDEEVKAIYDEIKLPTRATSGSAGYDFFSPLDFKLAVKENILIPTGVRVKIEQGWFLGVFPKSGLGFKYRLQVDNTVGIIDSDYYYSDNQGHIFIKMTNDNNKNLSLEINKGASFCQGIFLPFGITHDDDCQNIRNGGLGSTSR